MTPEELMAKLGELIEAYESGPDTSVVGAYLTFDAPSESGKVDAESVWEWSGRGFEQRDYLEVRVKPS